MKLKFLILPAMLFFAGCNGGMNLSISQNDSGICKTEPSWVLNPPAQKDEVYGVGIAAINFGGEQAQRKAALAKAINEIATQLNTTVNSQVVTSASVANGRGDSFMHSVSFQTTNGQKVSATIVKSCKNPTNGYLYILMKAKR